MIRLEMPVRKPTLEEFGLSEERLAYIEAKAIRLSAFSGWYYAAWASIAVILYLITSGGTINVSQIALSLVIGFVVIAGVRMIVRFRLHHSALYRKAFDFREDELQYEAWWQRTQESFWLSLSGTHFECELAQLYRALGHTATLTAHSGDEGIDILLVKDGKTFVVQCKAHRKAVGPSTIRELYGTLIASGADGAILASLSGFTVGVVRYVQDKPIELLALNDIIEYQRLIEMRLAGEGLRVGEPPAVNHSSTSLRSFGP